MSIYVVNVVLSLMLVFVLGLAIAADWANIRPMWKPLLIAVTVEQCVLAYANLEARAAAVPVETRLVLLLLSLASLLLCASLTLVIVVRSRLRR